MDPFSTLSIATSVVQFVDFAGKLLSSSNEIFHSVHGSSSSNSALESYCTTIKDLSAKLGSSVDTSQGALAQNVKSLADDCKSDCDALLAMLQNMKVKSQKSRRWKSFQVALKTQWGARKLREFEERMDKARNLAAIYVQSLTRFDFEPEQ